MQAGAGREEAVPCASKGARPRETGPLPRSPCGWRAPCAPVGARVDKGQVVYGAGRTNFQKLTFWRCLDGIGVDAYFSLVAATGDPLHSVLETAWRTQAARLAARIRAGLRKPVAVAELGYSSEEGTPQNAGPTCWTSPLTSPLQARLYAATFPTVYRQPCLPERPPGMRRR